MGILTKSVGLPDHLGECIKSTGPPDLADSILEEKTQNISENSMGIPTKSSVLPDFKRIIRGPGDCALMISSHLFTIALQATRLQPQILP